MNGAQILAVAGVIAGVLGTVGGWVGSVALVGLGSAVMLAGNLAAFAAERHSAPQTATEREAVEAIVRECARARQAHPRPFNSDHEGWAVLREEVDEMWEDVKANRKGPARTEAVQVGAMALRFLIDRGRS